MHDIIRPAVVAALFLSLSLSLCLSLSIYLWPRNHDRDTHRRLTVVRRHYAYAPYAETGPGLIAADPFNIIIIIIRSTIYGQLKGQCAACTASDVRMYIIHYYNRIITCTNKPDGQLLEHV